MAPVTALQGYAGSNLKKLTHADKSIEQIQLFLGDTGILCQPLPKQGIAKLTTGVPARPKRMAHRSSNYIEDPLLSSYFLSQEIKAYFLSIKGNKLDTHKICASNLVFSSLNLCGCPIFAMWVSNFWSWIFSVIFVDTAFAALRTYLVRWPVIMH